MTGLQLNELGRGTNLLKFVKRYVHETPSAEHFKHQTAQITADCLHQPQGPLNRILGCADLLQVAKYGHQWASDTFQFGGRKQIIEWKVLHKSVVVGYHRQRRLQTCDKKAYLMQWCWFQSLFFLPSAVMLQRRHTKTAFTLLVGGTVL